LTSNADSIAGDDEELVEIVGVAAQRVFEALALEIKLRIRADSQVDDAGMRPAVAKYEFAEVPIISDEDPLFAAGNGEDILVLEARRMINCDGRDVMAQSSQEGAEPSVSALIHENFTPQRRRLQRYCVSCAGV